MPRTDARAYLRPVRILGHGYYDQGSDRCNLITIVTKVIAVNAKN